MELYPSFDARERLYDALARLGNGVGWDPFVAGPILTPEPRWFPDAWTPDRRGVRRFSTRLLRYAGLEYDVAVAVEAPPEEHVAAWFSGLDEDTCYFGIDPRQLEREDSFVAALCHETAHAFRRHHEVELSNRDREEEATDLTAAFLGFGIFLANAGDQFETTSEMRGAQVITKTHIARLGYLSPIALSFLLAVQAIVRGTSKKDRREIAGHLRANQRASFEKALEELGDSRSFLLDRLKLPDPASWPEPRNEPVLDDLGIDEDEDEDEDEAPGSEGAIGDGRYVMRMLDDAGRRYALWGLFLGGLAGGALSACGGMPTAGGRLFVTMGASALAWFGGRFVGRQRREDTCATCGQSLPAYEDRCATCRARVVADVRSVSERVELEDRIERLGLERALPPRRR